MKTNHRRNYKDKRDPSVRATHGFHEQVVADDGVVIRAAGGFDVDHCCGKHGIAKDRAGAKKFLRSRLRRRNRDALKKALTEV